MSLTDKYAVARWQNRPVSRRRSRTIERRKPLFLFLLGGFIFVGLFCMQCWQKRKLLECGYRIETVKKQMTEMEEKYRQLKLEEAHLLTPARINQIAQDQLGMAAPTSGQFIFDVDVPAEDHGAIAMNDPNPASKPKPVSNF